VNTDAYFYNRYLPMVFINHHFDDPQDNPRVIKYFIGTPLLYLPFFGISCLLSYLFHYPVDGYSVLFPVFITLGTLFYLMWGLFYFSKFLRFFKLPDWIISFVIAAIALGTNAFYSTVMAPGWCHIVAFGLVCFLLYHIKKLYVSFNKRSVTLIIGTISFLFFVRPTDVCVLLVAPFLADNWKHFSETIKRILNEKRAIIFGILIASIPLICQLAIYKAATGHYLIWSYTKEKFDFAHPEITNVLFSYAKGLFVYTPICFLSLFGLFKLFKKNRYLFYGVVLYLGLTIYIISSWWCWNYGYSFGARVFIEHFPMFFLLLALLLDVKNVFIKTGTIISIVLFTALNLFQTYQAETGILDKDFETDAKGYWNVFLRTDKGYSSKFYRLPVDESPNNIIKRTVLFNDMEKRDTTWFGGNTITTEKAHSGMFSSKVNRNSNYSVGIRRWLSEFPDKKNSLIRVTGWFYISQKGSRAFFPISFVNKGESINYNPYHLDGYTEKYGEWEEHTFEVYMPKFKDKIEKMNDNQVEFYLYNDSNIDCYVDDLKIEFIQFKKMDRVLDISWD
jgi:hypothetical protein